MIAGALSLPLNDVAFFSPMPGSPRSTRGTRRSGRIAATFRWLRHEVAIAAESASASLPHVTRRYPY